mgnify:CR=1 FL=1
MDITLLLYYRSMGSITRLIVRESSFSFTQCRIMEQWRSKNISFISFFEKSKVVILGLSYFYICNFFMQIYL